MKLSHQATILATTDMNQSLSFYEDQLGFTCTFRWQDPPTYAILKRGPITLNLTLENKVNASDHAALYIFCHDVVGLYQEYVDKGLTFLEPLNTTDYQMQEFLIQDPDGNKVVFGQGTE